MSEAEDSNSRVKPNIFMPSSSVVSIQVRQVYKWYPSIRGKCI